MYSLTIFIVLFQGGLVYIAVKGVFRIYQRQHNVRKERTRKIIDYPESETEENN